MATLAKGLRQFRCPRQLSNPQWHRQTWRQSVPFCIRALSMTPRAVDGIDSADPLEMPPIPHQGIRHARVLPATPSYFNRDAKFNDLVIRMSSIFARNSHLPILPPSEAPQVSWMKLEDLRTQLGEPVKSSHYIKLLRLAKRLNLIAPQMRSGELQTVLRELMRNIDGNLNKSKPIVIDQFGRAVAAGRRKSSTARAFLVEGTGEVLVNGKPLSEAFGRVHDRESAMWALTATQRLDKYNAWILVEGGGTTGQAEAITLAIGKALVAHEPALKTPLRKAGCITRDPRAVERKKHGHLKARKRPAWVKR
ncbi:37S ribosomal protein S9, mitochondrial [Claviceps humidiphila]|uniref:Small ribosomal subunit protein uS9m n=1 Tax=Claviceps humidiphila TaxID=1294629 RepID=A0A9P7TX97_9HYPO|nr:37S ribosomal protein S9, mitochondrial [Claviceps humidiphila]